MTGPGEIAFLPADRTYVGSPSAVVETIAVYVGPQFALEQLRWLPSTAPFLEELFRASEPQLLAVTPSRRAQLRRRLHKLTWIEVASPDAELQQMAVVASVFGLIHPGGEMPVFLPDLRYPEVEEAIRILESDLECSWTVRALADRVALSPSQLTRLFARHTGMSPARYLPRPARAGCINFSSKAW